MGINKMAKKAKKKATAKKKKTRSSIGGKSGRTNSGKFTEGNQCSVGNKGNTREKTSALKRAALEAVTENDIKAIFKKLAKKAKAGDVQAAKELFDRIWGKAKQEVDIGENAVKSITDILAIVGVNVDYGDSRTKTIS